MIFFVIIISKINILKKLVRQIEVTDDTDLLKAISIEKKNEFIII